jgi:hypothetical protein
MCVSLVIMSDFVGQVAGTNAFVVLANNDTLLYKPLLPATPTQS